MSVTHLGDFVLIESLHFFLALEKLIISIVVFDIFVLDFLIELHDLLVLSVLLLQNGSLLVLLSNFNPIFQLLNICLVPVKFLLLNKDLFRLSDLSDLLIFLLRIFVIDRENAEDTILSCREQILVILRYSQSLDWQAVGLDFEDFLEVGIDDLDRSWPIIFCNTGEESSASMQKLNLRNVESRFICQNKFSVVDGLDCFVNASSIHNCLGFRFICHTGKLLVLDGECKPRVHVFGLFLISVELPAKDIAVPATRGEARVIIHPVDASDRSKMLLVDHILSVFSSVEFVDINVALRRACE